ncbi:MAG: transcription termination factor NusA [Planctomyces sp.]|nr:transcription termination factor NusA [Planctomyces sp.]
MNGPEILRLVDAISRDKNVDSEVVFEGIEQAILSAALKHYGEDRAVAITIDRKTGEPAVSVDGAPLPGDELGELLGRIATQTAKQVMIQKIREAERDSLFDEFNDMRSQMVTGAITRVDQGAASVNIGKIEALLPKSEQIPGETYKVGERVRCIVLEVRKSGTRIKVILSRTHPDLVRRLFEVEIPEVAERVIAVRSLAREAGYRSKVAVSCFDNSIDAVGACVGVRGSRIKTIVDELGGERIDIVRWNDNLQVLIPNALQPAETEDVILCPMLGRVIVLVREDQLSLAIGKRGQNVRLGSKLVGWDIEVMTREELDEQLDRSVQAFSVVPHVVEELAEMLVSQGFFSFADLSVIEPDQLQELSGLTEEQCDEIVEYADKESLREEQEEDRRKAIEKAAKAAEAQAAALDRMTGRSLGPGGEELEKPEKSAKGGRSSGKSEPAVAEAAAAEAASGETAAVSEESSPADESEAVEENSAVAGTADAEKDAEGSADLESPAVGAEVPEGAGDDPEQKPSTNESVGSVA